MAEPLKIYTNEAAIVAPLETRSAGTYTFPVELRGNALISTVWVEAINGATITATWKDHNPFTNDLFTVAAHAPITANGYHRKFIAQATHGVSVLEIVVAGGSPKFGVFATANQLVGNYPAEDSIQTIDGTVTVVEVPGVPMPLRSDVELSDPGGTVVLLSEEVPAGKAWRLLRLEGQARVYGFFSVWSDAVMLARSLSGPASDNPKFEFMPYDTAPAGDTVEVRFTQTYGPQVDVSAFLFVVETDV